MADTARCSVGEWVEVERVLLEPADRSTNLPEDTASQPLMTWVKGFALAPAEMGERGVGHDDDRPHGHGHALGDQPGLLPHLRPADPGAGARGR